MSDVEPLLAEATPLPWHAADRGIGWEVHSGAIPIKEWGSGPWCLGVTDNYRDLFTEADAALIVYAVNRLPAYEAAVEALRSVAWNQTDGPCWCDHPPSGGEVSNHGQRCQKARAAIARLRETEPS